MKFKIEELPFGKVSSIAESFVNLFGITSDIEIDSIVVNINMGGRGIPLSKYANSRGWSQAKVYALLKKSEDLDEDEEPYAGIAGLSYLTKDNIVTAKCMREVDGGRDDVFHYSNLTLYNAPDGTVMINTESERIDRIKGHMFGVDDCDSEYRKDFKKVVDVKNKKILNEIDGVKMLFPNMKMEYAPIRKSKSELEKLEREEKLKIKQDDDS